MTISDAPALQLVTGEPPNGKHFCTQKAELAQLGGMISALLSHSERQTDAINRIEQTLGGPSKSNPLENTGLIGAVQQVQKQVVILDKDDSTLVQSRDELIARAKTAESALETRNKLFAQIAIAVATGIASGGGLTWLVKFLEAIK